MAVKLRCLANSLVILLRVAYLSVAVRGANRISSKPFGATLAGEKFQLFTLKSGKYRVDITNFGGAMVRLLIPDARGRVADVTTGFDYGANYTAKPGNHGCIIGRYANRIANHSFVLHNKLYILEKSSSSNNTVHSGTSTFCTKVWNATTKAERSGASLILTYLSPDGDGGFPGTLEVKATYTLRRKKLTLTIEASTDKPTHVNLVHHPYFNLNGIRPGVNLTETNLRQTLQLNSKFYTPVTPPNESLPTGQFLPVAGTQFDFRKPVDIGSAIARNGGKGFDNNWVINRKGKSRGSPFPLAAILSDPESGRTMNIYTNQPGIQVFTANSFTGKLGKGGVPYTVQSFTALETQHYPDTPHHLDKFPSTVLVPGKLFKAVTIYAFEAERREKAGSRHH